MPMGVVQQPAGIGDGRQTRPRRGSFVGRAGVLERRVKRKRGEVESTFFKVTPTDDERRFSSNGQAVVDERDAFEAVELRSLQGAAVERRCMSAFDVGDKRLTISGGGGVENASNKTPSPEPGVAGRPTRQRLNHSSAYNGRLVFSGAAGVQPSSAVEMRLRLQSPYSRAIPRFDGRRTQGRQHRFHSRKT